MIFAGFAHVKIKIVSLLGEDINTDRIEKVCIFMWNFFTYTAAINKHLDVLLISTFMHTISFNLCQFTFRGLNFSQSVDGGSGLWSMMSC
jgi:hypothetical protein